MTILDPCTRFLVASGTWFRKQLQLHSKSDALCCTRSHLAWPLLLLLKRSLCHTAAVFGKGGSQVHLQMYAVQIFALLLPQTMTLVLSVLCYMHRDCQSVGKVLQLAVGDCRQIYVVCKCKLHMSLPLTRGFMAIKGLLEDIFQKDVDQYR